MNRGADLRRVAHLPPGEKVPAKQAEEGSSGGTSTPHQAVRATFYSEGRREAPVAIGVGFRKRCTAQGLASIVREALCKHPDLARTPAVLATIAEKDRPLLHAAAALLGLDVVILRKAALLDTSDRITVDSERVRACFGIPSVAEAAALAAAGPGARLVVARIQSADATCAIAIGRVP